MNLTNRNEYWFRLFVAFSLLGAAIFGAQMYESGCAAAWRLRNRSGFKGFWARNTVWLMDMVEKDHCHKASAYHMALRAVLLVSKQAKQKQEEENR